MVKYLGRGLEGQWHYPKAVDANADCNFNGYTVDNNDGNSLGNYYDNK